MNNPKQERALENMLTMLTQEVVTALARRAELDEIIYKGRAMIQALSDVKREAAKALPESAKEDRVIYSTERKS